MKHSALEFVSKSCEYIEEVSVSVKNNTLIDNLRAVDLLLHHLNKGFKLLGQYFIQLRYFLPET